MASSARSPTTDSSPVARAVALHAEAERWRDAGDPRRAAACARRAVALFARHEGRAHPDVAAALLALGGARELGDGWRDALAHYRRADAIMARYARMRDPDIRRLRVKAARALCGVLRALGRYAEAERHGRRAVSLAER